MERINIITIDHPYFPSVWRIYEFSFPLCERRTLEDQKRIFSDQSYFLDAWIEDGKVVGIIGWWNCENLRFVEHYAIAPEYRSSGYGSSFLSEWINDSITPVLLEIEPVVDEITQRRKKFYMNLGFLENNIKHKQPPYHKETGYVEMQIMSYPRLIEEKDYQTFYQKQCSEIMPVFR